MTDQPELYRVQTTDGKSVVVYRDKMFTSVYRQIGYATGPILRHNNSPLARLHLLTDKELQARDAELLERVAEKFDCATQDGLGDERRAVADEIRAMKGQTHER